MFQPYPTKGIGFRDIFHGYSDQKGSKMKDILKQVVIASFVSAASIVGMYGGFKLASKLGLSEDLS